ncbi:MAG: anthranilate synthase component I, partial [Rhodospirillaceae bacterium]|nr:anthranilate synthase component I [Rhodospirillaceae bacterium]
METLPDFDAFATTYNSGSPQLVWTVLVADLETPVSAMLKLADDPTYSFLLESVQGGEVRGRYSAIGLKPDLIWRCRQGKAEINRNGLTRADDFSPCTKPPLESLRALIAECRIDIPAPLPPMAAGLFGYMGYDMVRQMESLPDNNPDPLDVPEGVFLRPTVMAVFDTIEDSVFVITPVWPQNGVSAQDAYNRAQMRLAETRAKFDADLPPHHTLKPLMDEAVVAVEPSSNTTREEYHAIVEKAKEYIRAGDIFQVVPSQRFSLPFSLPPFSLYRALRRLNPSPFLFHFNFGDFSVVGSSPEI